MSKRSRKKAGEPRNGALLVTVLVLFISAIALAAYLFFVPSGKKDTPKGNTSTTLRNVTSAGPKNSALPNADSSSPDHKTAENQLAYPKADETIPGEIPRSNLKPGTGSLAIIVDDMGSSMSEARSLAAIGVPLDFSIIPGLKNFREVAVFAGSRGIETMIHIPMQSKGWPERRLEANGLLLSMSDAEIRERVAGFLSDIPGAVGANNHMGSEFSEHEDRMGSVLETLKSKNLFFVDSVTSTDTVGLRLAREMGMKSGRRHVFLDNIQERGYILGQLDQAVRLSRKTGVAIAICHPHPETIAALASVLPGLAAKGITLVPVSQLVR